MIIIRITLGHWLSINIVLQHFLFGNFPSLHNQYAFFKFKTINSFNKVTF